MKRKVVFIVSLILIFGVSTVMAASYLYHATEVSFTSSNKNWDADNVKDALDDLYARLDDGSDLKGAEPVITGDLIPVTISSDGTVTRADTNSKWYDYGKKEWANAVILIDKTKSYSVGDTILEANIESYFVWIPKYRYRLWNTGTASKKIHQIDIIFGDYDTKDSVDGECTTPMTSGNVGNCKNGDYMTHPAFLAFNKKGFWVGKFEVGYKGATSTATAQVNANDSSKVIVKPNSYSWRNITVANMFNTSKNYQTALDSHMMKNTEWGAVAYLSHSKFGIGYEININNNSSYLTGYSALLSTDQQTYPGTYGTADTVTQPYNTEVGYLASTTGNITGVYDMSGGAHEYMASYISGKPGSAGFTPGTDKYYDVYSTSSSVSNYKYMILGDATGEMGPFKSYLDGDNSSRWHNSWYGDISNFVEASDPWFVRGGIYDHGVLAGQFNFNRGTGGVYTNVGFRLVLAP